MMELNKSLYIFMAEYGGAWMWLKSVVHKSKVGVYRGIQVYTHI